MLTNKERMELLNLRKRVEDQRAEIRRLEEERDRLRTTLIKLRGVLYRLKEGAGKQ